MSVLPFSYSGQEVRVIQVGGEPWFVVTDVADVLELSNPSVAVAGLDEDEKGLRKVETQVRGA